MSALAFPPELHAGDRGARRGALGAGRDPTATVELPLRIRLPDSRIFEREAAAWHHRRLHLSMLHRTTNGFIEIGQGWRSPGAKTWWGDRDKKSSIVPGGGVPGHEADWLDRALDRVAAAAAGWRTEVAVTPAARRSSSPKQPAIASTRWLWLDVDQEALPRLHDVLRERPAHLRVESAGDGGEHAYWLLDRPLPAARIDRRTGEVCEWIERANRRLIRHVGGSDPAGAVPGRLMRLSGTVNYRHGRHARIILADLALPPYRGRDLVGDLPDLSEVS